MEKRELWSERVREWQASGQGFADYCRGKEFTPGGLRYWVKRLGVPVKASPEASAGTTNPVRIARVVRAGSRQRPAEGAGHAVGRLSTTAWSAGEHFVIEAGPMRVLVPVGLDPTRLEAVLVAVGRASNGGAM